MKIEFLSKNYSPSDKLKTVIEHKLEKLDKFFEDDTKIKVMLKQSKEIYTLELTIVIDRGVLRAEVSSDNMYNNIDVALPKLEKQIIKHHKKIEAKFKKFKAKDFALKLMNEIWEKLKIPSTVGIGTNMYLAKVALDITAKHSPDFIGILNEESYRRTLWQHQPITDFWRIGRGTAGRLARYGIHTMEDIALAKEELLYKAFGIDAELLIDHAWGREPVAIADIKSYTPQSTSISRGQVLLRDYTADEGRLILREMLDLMCLDLVEQNSVTGSVCIYIGYSHTCGAPSARGSTSLCIETSSDKIIIPAVLKVYDRIIDSNLPIRRINISFNNLTENSSSVQLSFFEEADSDKLERCLSIQQAVLSIKKRYGKNAVLKGMNFLEGATTRERNDQIGGHKRGA